MRQCNFFLVISKVNQPHSRNIKEKNLIGNIFQALQSLHQRFQHSHKGLLLSQNVFPERDVINGNAEKLRFKFQFAVSAGYLLKEMNPAYAFLQHIKKDFTNYKSSNQNIRT